MKTTEKNGIREMGMGEILKSEYEVDYVDGDIAIIDDLKDLPAVNPVKFNLILIVICVEGKLQLDVNEKTYVIRKNDILTCTPHIMINNYMISPDFKGKVCGLSERFTQQMLHSSRFIWNKAFYISKNPIIHMNEEDVELFNHYYDIIYMKVKKEKRLYHEEVMKALLQAAFYELSADLNNFVSEAEDDLIRQGDILFKNFMELLYHSKIKSRSVSWYAGQLHVTPKYLSAVCKKLSGKTASKWINEYVVEDIRSLLKHSTLSVKEISQELDFPNLSFFGKYVKAHLEMSPKNYRKQFKK